MKPKGLQLEHLWRFRGLGFCVKWLYFKFEGFYMTKLGCWLMEVWGYKVYDVCTSWKFKLILKVHCSRIHEDLDLVPMESNTYVEACKL
jgi:hypothetical protein